MNKLSYSLIFFLIGILIGGSLIYYQVKPSATSKNEDLAGCKIGSDSDLEEELEKKTELSKSDLEAALSYLKFKKIKESFVPSGAPELSYGKELKVNFDEVQESMNKLRVYGPTYGEEGKKITLSGGDKERYINITSKTSCRYCCGAKALVRENGEPACGCAHSIVMRGLAAYLIKNYPQLSDERILKELNTWLKTFFPKQTLTQELQRRKEAGEAGIEELLETFPEFMPQMVGGC